MISLLNYKDRQLYRLVRQIQEFMPFGPISWQFMARCATYLSKSTRLSL